MALIYIVEDDRNISEIESYALKMPDMRQRNFIAQRTFMKG